MANKKRAREFYRRRQEAKLARALAPVDQAATSQTPDNSGRRNCHMDVKVHCPGHLDVRPAFTMRRTEKGSIMVNVRLDLVPSEVFDLPPGFAPQKLDDFPATPAEMLRMLGPELTRTLA